MKITVENLNKTYNNAIILDNISFSADGTSSIGIIGESGCGKSTLLRQLAGIESPDSGKIIIDGLSPQDNKTEFQSEIGYVFQKANLFPHLTIKKNILLILEKIKKISKDESEEKLEKALSQLHIESIADKKPNQVSGGQAQRASIARALVTDPKLIFLDEPTAALDPVLTDEVLSAVLSLKESGRNFIFVTHEISFIKDFADYVIFMKNGKIAEMGDVSILNNPQTDELKTFLRKH